MTNSDSGADDPNFVAWCEAAGLDRDFVRRHHATLRRRFDNDPATVLMPAPPPLRPYDRYGEL